MEIDKGILREEFRGVADLVAEEANYLKKVIYVQENLNNVEFREEPVSVSDTRPYVDEWHLVQAAIEYSQLFNKDEKKAAEINNYHISTSAYDIFEHKEVEIGSKMLRAEIAPYAHIYLIGLVAISPDREKYGGGFEIDQFPIGLYVENGRATTYVTTLTESYTDFYEADGLGEFVSRADIEFSLKNFGGPDEDDLTNASVHEAMVDEFARAVNALSLQK